MATLTIRMPDDKHQRLKELAESQGISVNKLIEELSTVVEVQGGRKKGEKLVR
jgi:predicted HicB family RNase H-like nuclease